MKRTFLVLLVLFATLFATAQDFTTEMKEDTTHYNPVCVANDTIYWSQMSKWRAYYLQKRAPVWKLSEKDSKNFDAKEGVEPDVRQMMDILETYSNLPTSRYDCR